MCVEIGIQYIIIISYVIIIVPKSSWSPLRLKAIGFKYMKKKRVVK